MLHAWGACEPGRLFNSIRQFNPVQFGLRLAKIKAGKSRRCKLCAQESPISPPAVSSEGWLAAKVETSRTGQACSKLAKRAF